MAKIAVIGGVAIDLVFGELAEWPMPGQATPGKLREEAGGKGLNQAVACSRLGAETSLISSVGDDRHGRFLNEVLLQEGVAPVLQVHEDENTDAVGVISLPRHRPSYIGCRRASDRLTPDFITANRRVIEEADGVLVTFDASLAATLRAIQIAKKAKNHPPIVINPAPPIHTDLTIISGANYLVPNEWEAKEWLRIAGTLTSEQLATKPISDVGKYLSSIQPGVVVITRGAAGSVVVDSNMRSYPAYFIEERDKTGASDAFCAALILQLAELGDAADSVHEYELIRFSSAAGALACTKLGAYRSMPTRREVEDFIGSHEYPLEESEVE